MVGLGVYFVALRPPLLPEDARYIGATLPEIQAAVPGLERWLRHVFTVMGGFMVGAGVLTIFVASTAVRTRQRGTLAALALSGLSTVAVMSAANFALGSDFKWLLVMPVLFWSAGVARYLLGEGDRRAPGGPRPHRTPTWPPRL